MKESKTSISKASSYLGIAEFWDKHDLGDYWDQTDEVEFKMSLKKKSPSRVYYGLNRSLSSQLNRLAKKLHVSTTQLVQSWLQEKLLEKAKKAV